MILAPSNLAGKLLLPRLISLTLTNPFDRVPPNVRFLVDDVEEPWADSQPFDFIQCRYMSGSIKDWPGLVKQIFDHLKPGGWAEFSDVDINLKSQDNTIP